MAFNLLEELCAKKLKEIGGTIEEDIEILKLGWPGSPRKPLTQNETNIVKYRHDEKVELKELHQLALKIRQILEGKTTEEIVKRLKEGVAKTPKMKSYFNQNVLNLFYPTSVGFKI